MTDADRLSKLALCSFELELLSHLAGGTGFDIILDVRLHGRPPKSVDVRFGAVLAWVEIVVTGVSLLDHFMTDGPWHNESAFLGDKHWPVHSQRRP